MHDGDSESSSIVCNFHNFCFFCTTHIAQRFSLWRISPQHITFHACMLHSALAQKLPQGFLSGVFPHFHIHTRGFLSGVSPQKGQFLRTHGTISQSDVHSTLQSWGSVHCARLTLRCHWLEGSQNAQAEFSFLGETRFGCKARPWSVPTQMQEVDQEILLVTSSDQCSHPTSHQNLRVSLDSICD